MSILVLDAYDHADPAGAVRRLQEATDYSSFEVHWLRLGAYPRGMASPPLGAEFPSASSAADVFNRAAKTAQGEWILFMDARVCLLDRHWLSALVREGAARAVGAVGGLLLYPQRTLRSAGLHLGVETLAGPPHRHASPDAPHPAGDPRRVRTVTAVPWETLLVRRSVFEELGGFDEGYFQTLYDVDFGLRLRARGLRCRITPAARLWQDVSCYLEEPFDHADARRLANRIRSDGTGADPFLPGDLDLRFLPEKREAPPGFRPADVLSQRLNAIEQACVRGEEPDRWENASVADSLARWGQRLSFPELARAEERQGTDRAWAAAGELLYRLRSDPGLRGRFPDALSGEPSPFLQWLGSGEGAAARTAWACEGGEWPTPDGGLPWDEAFALHPGHRPRRIYLWRADIRRYFPLGLLPEGRAGYLRWLLEFGRDAYALRDVEIWWFWMETAEAPSRELAFTWHHIPEWQARFPNALTPEGYPRFLAGLQRVFGLDPDRYSTLDPPRPAAGVTPTGTAEPQPGSVTAAAGVNILGHLALPCGLQYSALSAAEALRAAGVHCSLRDVPARETEEPPGREGLLGLETHDVTIVYLPPMVRLEHWYARAGLHPKPGVYRIGNWYWEFPEVPEEWPMNARGFREIWAPSQFLRDAFARAFPLPVFDMPPGVEVRPDACERKAFGLPEDVFVFLFMFDFSSTLERKNALGLIEAFRRAFKPSDPVLLMIKTLRGDEHPEDRARLRAAAESARVRLLDGNMPRGRVLGLMTLCDAYVSLHRSEGFGLTMAEAMLLGKPVIATGYSGNLDFMTPENSRLVGFAPVRAPPLRPPYQNGGTWAEPDIGDAAGHMRWAAEHPADAARLGERGRRDAEALLSPRAFGQRMADRLADLRRAWEPGSP